MVTFKLRDLDELNTEEEVTTAVQAALEKVAKAHKQVPKDNSRCNKLATVTLTPGDA